MTNQPSKSKNPTIMKTIFDSSTKIWSGPKVPANTDSKSSLGQLLIESLQQNPKKISQICCNNGIQTTSQEIIDGAFNVARNLKKLGLQQTDVVGFCAANTEHVASLVIGSLLDGLAISTLDPTFSNDGVKHIYSITKPKVFFCDAQNYERMREALLEIDLQIPIYSMTEKIDGALHISELLTGPGSKEKFSFEPLKEGILQNAFILCSSGTTGLPKGVAVPHRTLMGSSKILTPEDYQLSFSTLYWVSGLLSLVAGIFCGCTRLITSNPYTADEFLEIIEKFKATTIFSPPSHMASSLASPKIQTSDLSSVRQYFCTGSVVTPALVSRFKPHIPNAVIVVTYGMSEVPGFGISVTIAKDNGTVGNLVPNLEMRIVNDDGCNLGPNERGEILLRTEVPFSGYYNNLDSTAAAIDADGWLHSGDIGYFNESGELFVVDRKKEILKYNNFHFSPSEIEHVIMQIPGVAEVCVCGIPDDVSTFLPAAMIVLESDSNISEKFVYDYVAEKMDHFKRLRGGIYFVKNIPKTASGKNMRRIATELCVNLRKANPDHRSQL